MVLDRLRTTRLDAVLAVAFAVAGLVQLVVAPIARPGLGELFVIGTTAPLAWRRTFPLESSLISAAFWLIPLDGFPLLGFVVVILQFFALGAHGRSHLAVLAVAGWASLMGVIGTLLGPEPPVAAIGGVLVVVAPTGAGLLIAHQRRQNQALASLAAQLRVERANAEEAAVGAERARIAQELHDVVGHELTLIAIQAEAAAAALRVAPERAAEPVEAIRSTAHHTLSEIRAVLDVLAPLAGNDQVSADGPVELAERARAAGIANSLSMTGAPPPSHAPLSLTVSRIVRECLTNAGRHAPGQPVTMRVDWSPDGVSIRASNPVTGSATTPGRGLTGIRHRAELLGGTFDLSAADGVFDVQVRIPALDAL